MNIKNYLRHNTPLKIRPLLHSFEFRNELLNYYNVKKNKCNLQSILFFTTHKCASVGIKQLLPKLYQKTNYSLNNIDGFIAKYLQKNVKDEYDNNARIQKMFKTNGYIYSPLRKFIKIDNINKYKIIVFLRDPLDVIVSHFHSVTKSHGVINYELIKDRESAKKQSIDDFALSIYREYLYNYSNYASLANCENVLFLGYSEFINNPIGFAKKICQFSNITYDESYDNYIDQSINISNLKKGGLNHIRSGEVGLGKSELKKEIAELIEEEFEYYKNKLKY